MRLFKRNRPSALLAVVLASLMGVLAACSSDSPTRPDQTPAPPPGGGGSGEFSVSISASRDQVEVGSDQGVDITVAVRRVDSGAPPPNGSTVVVTTNLGDLGSIGSGEQSAVLQLFNGNAVVRLFAGATTGNALVQARIEDSLGSVQVQFVGTIDFGAGFLEPSTGSPTGGETVTIRGQGFQSPVRVEFIVAGPGGNLTASADVLSVGPEAIRIVTPASGVSVPTGSTVSADVRVTNRVGTPEQTAATITGGFLYALGGSILQPSVTSLSPTQGPNEGGTRVRILGDGFEAPVQVIFGSGGVGGFTGVEATVESVTRNEVTVITPSALGVGQDNRNSFVNVLVRNVTSGFATVANSAFRYGQSQIFISAVGPTEGPYQGGTIATLFGSGFEEPVAVELAGVGASIISVTGTEVVVRSNGIAIDTCADVAGDVELVNVETGDGASFDGWIYRVFPPTIFNINPSSAREGDSVTISGNGFETPVRVLFGDQAGSVTSASGSQVTVIAPPFNDFETESCDDNADGTDGVRDIPTQVGVTIINLITTCEDEFPNSFTYLPTDTTCRGDVGMTDPPDAPTAAFSFFVVSGNTVQFQNSSTGADTYQWDFTNDGTIDSGVSDPQFTFAGPGTYATRLVATGAGGSDTVINQVTIP
ncbi:MAG: IPT/TIG domain-containing protein [Acidobacteriota bacterium]|nr:IPT/TIG domain-containing protein [Acidobacteriota bacterium]